MYQMLLISGSLSLKIRYQVPFPISDSFPTTKNNSPDMNFSFRGVDYMYLNKINQVRPMMKTRFILTPTVFPTHCRCQ
jgi:hypothetical protein